MNLEEHYFWRIWRGGVLSLNFSVTECRRVEMASLLFNSLRKSTALMTTSYVERSSSSPSYIASSLLKMPGCSNCYLNAASYHGNGSEERERRRGGRKDAEEEEEQVPTEGISRPMSEILKQLNKKVPDSLISIRSEEGFPVKYVPWHVVNRIMNLHAPEWSGEVRSIIYSADGKSVSVVYRVTLHGTDAEGQAKLICIELSDHDDRKLEPIKEQSTALVQDKGIGDAVQKAEAMAFRRACARLGLGLHLYHEDLS
ncbi:hypothetical protein Cgig2_013314 [Carnegiea gigantea]|uniref:Uncharacterized protein n=1 Tax=Carnegiea gigantea TaxID=171969 RepID=A0A9Q1GXW8_9CARY|nr:hypothetical protein Cgig2_013314 [Carnegiea gigantea]